MSESQEVARLTPQTILDSKLYLLARSTVLLGFLKGEMQHQMIIEAELDAIAPRKDEDGDKMRVLITYRNARGNATLIKFEDAVGYGRKFDIDNFLEGYQKALGLQELPEDPIEAANIILLSALNQATADVLGFGDKRSPKAGKLLSQNLLFSIITLVFNHPLDVYMAVAELPNSDSPPVIQGLWAVKYRRGLNQMTVPMDDNGVIYPQMFSDLSTPEDVAKHRYINETGFKSVSVEYLGKVAETRDEEPLDRFKITWDNDDTTVTTYDEGTSIKIAPLQDLG